jgi:hypothetical protein
MTIADCPGFHVPHCTYEYLITKTDDSKKYKKVTKVEFSLKKLVSSSQLFVDADFGSVESL